MRKDSDKEIPTQHYLNENSLHKTQYYNAILENKDGYHIYFPVLTVTDIVVLSAGVRTVNSDIRDSC
jgi:hypothetical protein